MRADELWVEAYQGEVRGETFFGRMAEREDDVGNRGKLERLTLLERATKELAEPVLERRGVEPGEPLAPIEALPHVKAASGV